MASQIVVIAYETTGMTSVRIYPEESKVWQPIMPKTEKKLQRKVELPAADLRYPSLQRKLNCDKTSQ